MFYIKKSNLLLNKPYLNECWNGVGLAYTSEVIRPEQCSCVWAWVSLTAPLVVWCSPIVAPGFDPCPGVPQCFSEVVVDRACDGQVRDGLLVDLAQTAPEMLLNHRVTLRVCWGTDRSCDQRTKNTKYFGDFHGSHFKNQSFIYHLQMNKEKQL